MNTHKNIVPMLIIAAASVIAIGSVFLAAQNALPGLDPSLKNYYTNIPGPITDDTTSEPVSETSKKPIEKPVDTVVIQTEVEPAKIDKTKLAADLNSETIDSEPETITNENVITSEPYTTATAAEPDVMTDTTPVTDTENTATTETSVVNTAVSPAAPKSTDIKEPEITPVSETPTTVETPKSIITDMPINDDVDKAYAALYSYDYELNNDVIIDELTHIGDGYGMSLNKDFHASCFHDGSIHPYNIEDTNIYTAAITYKTDPSDIRDTACSAFSEINKSYGDMRGLDFNVEIIEYIDLSMPAPSTDIRNCYAIIILYK